MQKGSLLETIKKLKADDGASFAPEKGEIVTHAGAAKDVGYIYLLEYEFDPNDGYVNSYDKRAFREIQPPMSIPESLFNSIPELVTI